MADQTLRAYAVDRGARSRGARRSAGAATGIVAHLATVGLVAAATAGVFLGTGYFLLLHPQHDLLAKADPGSSPKPDAAAATRPAEPGPAAAKPVAAPITVAVAPTPDPDSVANKSVSPPTVAHPAPISAPTPASASPEATTALSPAEIAALLHQGEASFRTGDVESARVFYRHAAEAGDAQAALRMGATFDPAMLSRGRLRNHFGDRTEARLWYLRAFDMGAAEAAHRLDRLAKETALR